MKDKNAPPNQALDESGNAIDQEPLSTDEIEIKQFVYHVNPATNQIIKVEELDTMTGERKEVPMNQMQDPNTAYGYDQSAGYDQGYDQNAYDPSGGYGVAGYDPSGGYDYSGYDMSGGYDYDYSSYAQPDYYGATYGVSPNSCMSPPPPYNSLAQGVQPCIVRCVEICVARCVQPCIVRCLPPRCLPPRCLPPRCLPPPPPCVVRCVQPCIVRCLPPPVCIPRCPPPCIPRCPPPPCFQG
jgi:hypothetical protein